jgi:hypothetical protein
MEVRSRLHDPAASPPARLGYGAAWSPEPVWTRWQREKNPHPALAGNPTPGVQPSHCTGLSHPRGIYVQRKIPAKTSWMTFRPINMHTGGASSDFRYRRWHSITDILHKESLTVDKGRYWSIGMIVGLTIIHHKIFYVTKLPGRSRNWMNSLQLREGKSVSML